jgi:hypothetical protein
VTGPTPGAPTVQTGTPVTEQQAAQHKANRATTGWQQWASDQIAALQDTAGNIAFATLVGGLGLALVAGGFAWMAAPQIETAGKDAATVAAAA